MNLAKLFKSLADETRLKIIRMLLQGNFTVNEILYVVQGTQSNISHHLKVLSDNSVIIGKKEGSQIYYKLNDSYNNKTLRLIMGIIKENITSISSYKEDEHRLENIYDKRKKLAKRYFNNLDEEEAKKQINIFDSIYTIEDYIDYFREGMGTILDIGCGNGRNLPILAEYCSKIIGIDSSPKMLQFSEHMCKINQLDYELKIADITRMPFADSSIDGILINMVLHHVSEPFSALKEVGRVLKEDGKAVLIDFLLHNDEEMQEKYADLWLGFPEKELLRWIKQCNLKVTNRKVKSDSRYDVIILYLTSGIGYTNNLVKTKT